MRGGDQYACSAIKHPSRLSPSPGEEYAATCQICEIGAETSPHRVRRAKSLNASAFLAPCGVMRVDQLEDFGAVARVGPAHPPNRAALSRWSAFPALPMHWQRRLCRGCAGRQMGQGGGRASGHGSSVWRPSADRIPVNWRLPHGGMRGQPPDALRRHQGCRSSARGARQASGEGVEAWQWLRVSFTKFIVHPDARILALECVATADMGGRRWPPGHPPPCGWARGKLRRRCGRGRRGGPGRARGRGCRVEALAGGRDRQGVLLVPTRTVERALGRRGGTVARCRNDGGGPLGLACKAGGRGRAHPYHDWTLAPRRECGQSTAGRSYAIRAMERRLSHGRQRCRALIDGNLTPWAVEERWAGLSRAIPGHVAKSRFE